MTTNEASLLHDQLNYPRQTTQLWLFGDWPGTNPGVSASLGGLHALPGPSAPIP